MKITNKLNLPEAFINLAKGDEEYSPSLNSFGATTLLKSTREIVLGRRHYHEMEQDVSDMIAQLFGTAIHETLSRYDSTNYSEIKYKIEILPGYFLVGIIDLFDIESATVIDYKTPSVNKVLRNGFKDWKRQGLMYVWLIIKSGFWAKRMRFIALLKDWSARNYKEDYPETAVFEYTRDVGINDLNLIEDFIKEKFVEIIKCEKLLDEELPLCTPEERWNTGDSWAVIKKGGVRAWRVFENEEEARKLALEINADVGYRPGEDKKCDKYCPVKKFCKREENKK